MLDLSHRKGLTYSKGEDQWIILYIMNYFDFQALIFREGGKLLFNHLLQQNTELILQVDQFMEYQININYLIGLKRSLMMLLEL